MFWLSCECFSILCNAFLLKSAISSQQLWWMGLNCLKATEPPRDDSLLFMTKFPEIPDTHLIKPRSMRATLKPPSCFELGTNNLAFLQVSTLWFTKYKLKSQYEKLTQLLRRKLNNNNQNKSGLIIQRWSGGLMFQITHLKWHSGECLWDCVIWNIRPLDNLNSQDHWVIMLLMNNYQRTHKLMIEKYLC